MEVQKISDQDIDFYKERKILRLSREYYEHREKSINGLIDLKNNLSLANQLSALLKDNENDVDLVHSKKVIMNYCLEKFKNIKKEDLEVIESKKKMENIRTTISLEKEREDNNSAETNKIHEETKLVLKKYYEMKGC